MPEDVIPSGYGEEGRLGETVAQAEQGTANTAETARATPVGGATAQPNKKERLKRELKKAGMEFKKILGKMNQDLTKKESRETYKKAARAGMTGFMQLARSVNQGMTTNFGSPFQGMGQPMQPAPARRRSHKKKVRRARRRTRS